MDLSKRLFISVVPGDTFLDKLTGKTKVRLFLGLIVLLVATWDIRIVLPVLVLGIIGLVSIKPNWRLIMGLMGFVALMNLFNLFLIWIVSPDYGNDIVGGATLLVRFTDRYSLSAETLWLFMVRFVKFISSFLVSLVFIQSITPSEMAAGLYAIKVPYKVATMVSIAFRYIPEISRDFSDIKISMQARGMELDPKKTSLIERLKHAMDLRGYGRGKTRTYYSEHEETPNDRKMKVFYMLVALAAVAVIAGRVFFPAQHEVWAPWI